MDSRDRDKFYTYTPEDDDGDEYELEPPDEHVIAGEKQRAKDALEATKSSIDINEIYRDAAQERSSEILENWFRDFKFGFRFQVKHLLIATAVLAIILTLAKLKMLGTTAVILVMLGVAGLYLYLQWQEKKAQDEATRRRHEMYARRRAHFEQSKRVADLATGSATVPPVTALPVADEMDNSETESRPKFRLRFSMAELLIAMTTAAVIFGLVQILGGASNTATLLGFLALIGLVVHALGFEPPGVIVLGWWFILVLYVVLSIAAALWSGIA